MYFNRFILTALLFTFSCADAHALKIQKQETKSGIQHYLITGKIKDGEHKMVISALKKRDPDIPTLITLNSKGGNLQSAMFLGRHFRAIGVGTRVLDNCFSACTLIALSGYDKISGRRWRQVHRKARFGVHRFKELFEKKKYNSRDMHLAVEQAQRRIWKILKYLQDMNVPPEFLELTLSTNSNRLRYLSPTELKRMNFEVLDSR